MKEQTKLVILGALFVLACALFVTQFMGASGGAAPTVPPSPAAGVASADASDNPSGTIRVMDTSSLALDPFRRVLKGGVRASSLEAGTAGQPEGSGTAAALPPSREIAGEIRGLEVPRDIVDPPATPVLRGVLLGGQPMAVIQLGDETHFAKVGEKLPTGHQVVEILEDSVVLKQGRSQHRLSLSGRK